MDWIGAGADDEQGSGGHLCTRRSGGSRERRRPAGVHLSLCFPHST